MGSFSTARNGGCQEGLILQLDTTIGEGFPLCLPPHGTHLIAEVEGAILACKLPEAFDATCRDDNGKIIPAPHGGERLLVGPPWLLPLLAVGKLQPLKQTQEPHHL